MANGRWVDVNSVSCAAAGNCAVGGDLEHMPADTQGFVVSETNRRWGKAIEMPGPGTLIKSGDTQVNSVSCPSAGRCAAGGDSLWYSHNRYYSQGFVTQNGGGGAPAELLARSGAPAAIPVVRKE